MRGTYDKTSKKALIVILVLLVVLSAAVFIPVQMYKSYIKTPVSKESRNIAFRVDKGDNSSIVLEKLSSDNIIKNRLFAKIYLKNSNIGSKLKYGVYILNTSMTPAEIFDKIFSGKPDKDPNLVTVTIPEGLTVKEIGERLKEAGLIGDVNSFINECQTGSFDYDFIKSIPKNRKSRLEGYLFPDTYEFKKGTAEHEIITKMLDRFDEVYKTAILPGIKGKDITVDEIVTMASIVEGEAKIESERPLISAVFYNRLKKNIRLESCATVQYALGTHKSVLLYKDLEVDSPYNTYRHDGLPAGPICNPGKSSIKAAINPAEVNYIYFIAKGDGSHYFTSSYNEFLKYKKSLKN